jgi:hypothetical protein
MPHSSHPPWLDNPNNILWSTQIMKLLIMQSSPGSRHFLPRRTKYSQHPVLQNLLCSSLSVRDQVSHPYKTGKKSFLYTLIKFWGGDKTG